MARIAHESLEPDKEWWCRQRKRKGMSGCLEQQAVE